MEPNDRVKTDAAPAQHSARGLRPRETAAPGGSSSDRRSPAARASSTSSGVCSWRGSPNSGSAPASRFAARGAGQAAPGPSTVASTSPPAVPLNATTPPRGSASVPSSNRLSSTRASAGAKDPCNAARSTRIRPGSPAASRASCSADNGPQSPPQAARTRRNRAPSSDATSLASGNASAMDSASSPMSSSAPISVPSGLLKSWHSRAQSASARSSRESGSAVMAVDVLITRPENREA